MNLLTNVGQFFRKRAQRAPELEDWNIVHEPLDAHTFAEKMRAHPKFAEEMREQPTIVKPDGGTRTIEDAPHLFQEVYHGHHNSRLEVAVRDANEVKPSLRWQNEVA